jgi:hypothetical protein
MVVQGKVLSFSSNIPPFLVWLHLLKSQHIFYLPVGLRGPCASLYLGWKSESMYSVRKGEELNSHFPDVAGGRQTH